MVRVTISNQHLCFTATRTIMELLHQAERGHTYVVRYTYEADAVVIHSDPSDKHASHQPSVHTIGGIGSMPEPIQIRFRLATGQD